MLKVRGKFNISQYIQLDIYYLARKHEFRDRKSRRTVLGVIARKKMNQKLGNFELLNHAFNATLLADICFAPPVRLPPKARIPEAL